MEMMETAQALFLFCFKLTKDKGLLTLNLFIINIVSVVFIIFTIISLKQTKALWLKMKEKMGLKTGYVCVLLLDMIQTWKSRRGLTVFYAVAIIRRRLDESAFDVDDTNENKMVKSATGAQFGTRAKLNNGGRTSSQSAIALSTVELTAPAAKTITDGEENDDDDDDTDRPKKPASSNSQLKVSTSSGGLTGLGAITTVSAMKRSSSSNPGTPRGGTTPRSGSSGALYGTERTDTGAGNRTPKSRQRDLAAKLHKEEDRLRRVARVMMRTNQHAGMSSMGSSSLAAAAASSSSVNLDQERYVSPRGRGEGRVTINISPTSTSAAPAGAGKSSVSGSVSTSALKR